MGEESEKFRVPKRLHEQASAENPAKVDQLSEVFAPSTESVEEAGRLIGDLSTADALLHAGPAITEEDGNDFSPVSNQTEESFEVPVSIEVNETILLPGKPEGLRSTNLVEVRKGIENDIETALETWSKYEKERRVSPYRWPKDQEDLSRYNRNMDSTIEKLAKIKLDLIEFGNSPRGKTPGGENIGDTMHPVLIPWEFFSENSGNGQLAPALQRLRGMQNIKEHIRDYPFVLDQLAEYELKQVYFSRPYSSQVFSSLFRDNESNTKHLHDMFYADGWWGIMLMQTGKDVGVSSIDLQEEVEQGSPTIAGYDIGRLGIYEWLALTLQESPDAFHNTEDEILVANRIFYESDDKQTKFLYAGWDNEFKRFRQYWIGGDEGRNEQAPLPPFRFRLAINPHLDKIEKTDES